MVPRENGYHNRLLDGQLTSSLAESRVHFYGLASSMLPVVHCLRARRKFLIKYFQEYYKSENSLRASHAAWRRILIPVGVGSLSGATLLSNYSLSSSAESQVPTQDAFIPNIKISYIVRLRLY